MDYNHYRSDSNYIGMFSAMQYAKLRGRSSLPMTETLDERTACTCAVELTAKLVGDKWTLLIIRDLAEGCKRFGHLQKSVTGISPRTLSDRLSGLEEAGLITREAFAEIPPRVEYRLTEMGRGLIPVLDAMRAYGQQWLAGREAEGVLE
jgi:DNA-binding HxlR family transcriptional regulator